MTMIVEDGSGVFGANSYATVAEADAYFVDRGNTAWPAATLADRETAMVRATEFIEKRYGRRFQGSRLYPVKKQAEATATFSGNPSNGDTITVGSTTYTFVNSASIGTNVNIGANRKATMLALVQATVANTQVSSYYMNGRQVVFTALDEGDDGDTIAVSKTSSVITWNFATLKGGNDLGVPQPLSFPRANLYFENYEVFGVPIQLKWAQYEYAVRALSADLMPDPVIDETGRTIVGKTEKIGPIEETVKYADIATIENAMRFYPGADSLLRPFLGSGNGGVSR